MGVRGAAGEGGRIIAEVGWVCGCACVWVWGGGFIEMSDGNKMIRDTSEGLISHPEL